MDASWAEWQLGYNTTPSATCDTGLNGSKNTMISKRHIRNESGRGDVVVLAQRRRDSFKLHFYACVSGPL